jgi:hypothetical protein
VVLIAVEVDELDLLLTPRVVQVCKQIDIRDRVPSFGVRITSILDFETAIDG